MAIGQKNIVDLPGGDKSKDDSAKKKGGGQQSATAQRVTQTNERDLRHRIAGCFTRIADAAEARGDEELAAVIREDTDVMATGLVSLTRPFKLLRAPLLLLLAVVEPVMAFSRIARLMLGRILDHRAARHEDPGVPPQ